MLHRRMHKIPADAVIFDLEWDLVLPYELKNNKNQLVEKAKKIVDEIAPPMFHDQIKLIPGTADTLIKIAAKGLRLALVTSTIREYMAIKLFPLDKAGVAGLFEVLVMCSDKLELSPRNCIYVGDTRVDVKAARAAGMRTVAVLTGFDDYEALERENPDAIIERVSDLKVTFAADSCLDA